jgi:hypothetical protein
MLKSVILNMLSSYVDESNKDTTVGVSVLGGNIEMDNVRFKAEALANMIFGGEEAMPFRMDVATSKKIKIIIPVTSLGSRSVKVELDGFSLQATIREIEKDWNIETCLKEMLEAHKLNMSDQFGKFLNKATLESGLFAKYHDPTSTINRQLARVVDNIHIDITNFSFLIKRGNGNPMFKISFSKLSTFTCDESYQVESFDSVVDFLSRKVIQLRDFTIQRMHGLTVNEDDEVFELVSSSQNIVTTATANNTTTTTTTTTSTPPPSYFLHPINIDIRVRLNTEKNATKMDALSRIDARILFLTRLKIEITRYDVYCLLLISCVFTLHDEFRKRVEMSSRRVKRTKRIAQENAQQNLTQITETTPSTTTNNNTTTTTTTTTNQENKLEKEYITLLQEKMIEMNAGRTISTKSEKRIDELERDFFNADESLEFMLRAFENINKVDPRSIFHTPLFSDTWTAESIHQLSNELLPAQPREPIEDDALKVIFQRDAPYGIEFGVDGNDIVVERVLRGQQAAGIGLIHPGMIVSSVNGASLRLLTSQGKLRVLECARRPTTVVFRKSQVGIQMEIGIVLPLACVEIKDRVVQSSSDFMFNIQARGICVHVSSRFPATKTVGVSIQWLDCPDLGRSTTSESESNMFNISSLLDNPLVPLSTNTSTSEGNNNNNRGISAGVAKTSVQKFLKGARTLLPTGDSSNTTTSEEDFSNTVPFWQDIEWKELYPDSYSPLSLDGGSAVTTTSNNAYNNSVNANVNTDFENEESNMGSSNNNTGSGGGGDPPTSPNTTGDNHKRPRWSMAMQEIKRWITTMHNSKKMFALSGCLRVRGGGGGSGSGGESNHGFLLLFKCSRPKRSDDLELEIGNTDLLLIPEKIVGLQNWWSFITRQINKTDFIQQIPPDSILALSLLQAESVAAMEKPLPPRLFIEIFRITGRIVINKNNNGSKEFIGLCCGPIKIISGGSRPIALQPQPLIASDNVTRPTSIITTHAAPTPSTIFSAVGECSLISTWLEPAIIEYPDVLSQDNKVYSVPAGITNRKLVFIEFAVRSFKVVKTFDPNEVMPELGLELSFQPIMLQFPITKYIAVLSLVERIEDITKSFNVVEEEDLDVGNHHHHQGELGDPSLEHTQQLFPFSSSVSEGSDLIPGGNNHIDGNNDNDDDYQSARGSLFSTSSSSIRPSSGRFNPITTENNNITNDQQHNFTLPRRNKKIPYSRHRLKRIIEKAIIEVLRMSAPPNVTNEQLLEELDMDQPIDLSREEMIALFRILSLHVDVTSLAKLSVNLYRNHLNYGSMTGAMLWLLIQDGGGSSAANRVASSSSTRNSNNAANMSVSEIDSSLSTPPPVTIHVGLDVERFILNAFDVIYMDIESITVGVFNKGNQSLASIRVRKALVRDLPQENTSTSTTTVDHNNTSVNRSMEDNTGTLSRSVTRIISRHSRSLHAVPGNGSGIHVDNNNEHPPTNEFIPSFTIRKSTRTSLDKDLITCYVNTETQTIPIKPKFVIERYFKNMIWKGEEQITGRVVLGDPTVTTTSTTSTTATMNLSNNATMGGNTSGISSSGGGGGLKATAVITGMRVVATYTVKNVVEDLIVKLNSSNTKNGDEMQNN